ncbi:glutathione S-transferase family protein [Altericroceibacterium xinjiangense]|uniref:glutathione S-transferase family protein n=1 Tax=Altericroceibacterium xinjiangense TaxID=762261 RepID=UPI000F7E38E4|nr:glutathione binding-like protein [Altericroceibacterium xinjiangense]
MPGPSLPILYHGEPTGPSLIALAALFESGLQLETRSIDLLAGERYAIPDVSEPLALDHSVEGEGPVLLIEGEAITDAVFLAQYFDEQAGGAGLQPSDPYVHWQMTMWCRQTSERLAPASACLGTFTHAQDRLAAMEAAEFERIAAQIESADLRERWRDLRENRVDSAQFADSKSKVAQFCERVEDQLADGRTWLFGGFSIADLVTFAWLRPLAETEAASFAAKEGLSAWLARTEARPSVRAALDQARTDDPLQAFAPGPEINRWG